MDDEENKLELPEEIQEAKELWSDGAQIQKNKVKDTNTLLESITEFENRIEEADDVVLNNPDTIKTAVDLIKGIKVDLMNIKGDDRTCMGQFDIAFGKVTRKIEWFIKRINKLEKQIEIRDQITDTAENKILELDETNRKLRDIGDITESSKGLISHHIDNFTNTMTFSFKKCLDLIDNVVKVHLQTVKDLTEPEPKVEIIKDMEAKPIRQNLVQKWVDNLKNRKYKKGASPIGVTNLLKKHHPDEIPEIEKALKIVESSVSNLSEKVADNVGEKVNEDANETLTDHT